MKCFSCTRAQIHVGSHRPHQQVCTYWVNVLKMRVHRVSLLLSRQPAPADLPKKVLKVIGSFLTTKDREALSVTCYDLLQYSPHPDRSFIHFRVSSIAAGVTSFISELVKFPHTKELVGASTCHWFAVLREVRIPPQDVHNLVLLQYQRASERVALLHLRKCYRTCQSCKLLTWHVRVWCGYSAVCRSVYDC